MGGGADTGSGLVGLAKKFALTGTSSMMAEVRVPERRRDEMLALCSQKLDQDSARAAHAAEAVIFVPDALTHAPELLYHTHIANSQCAAAPFATRN